MTEQAREKISLPGNPPAQPARVEAEQAKRRRRADTSETRNLKLSVPEHLKDPNFVYRWVNDKASGRILDKTTNDDWDMVKTLGPDKEEHPVSRNVGNGENGQPLKAYLLRKPKKYHEEDKAHRMAALKVTEEAVERGESVSPEGLDKSVSYVPGGKNSISRGR